MAERLNSGGDCYHIRDSSVAVGKLFSAENDWILLIQVPIVAVPRKLTDKVSLQD